MESSRTVHWTSVGVCLFVGTPGCLRVLNGSGGYRWHPIKESAGHLAIECSFKDPIVGRGGDQACVGCVSNRTCAYSAYQAEVASILDVPSYIPTLFIFPSLFHPGPLSFSAYTPHGVRLGNDRNGQRFILFTLH